MTSCLSPSMRGVLDTTICDKVCQWVAAGQWFSPGTPVSSINKTDRQDITEILLKVALSTINQPNYFYILESCRRDATWTLLLNLHTKRNKSLDILFEFPIWCLSTAWSLFHQYFLLFFLDKTKGTMANRYQRGNQKRKSMKNRHYNG